MIISRLWRLLGASPPLLLALLVGKLWLTGTLSYYVNDRTAWIVLLGALLFALIGLVGVRAALRPGAEAPSIWKTVAFFLPVMLGLLLPARPLSAATGQASSLGSLQLASRVSSGNPGDQFGTWIGDLATHPDPGWWQGQQVTLVGFVSLQDGLPPHSFIVARFLITHCVVDATLFGFPVQVDRARIPPDGAWVQVTGTFGQRYWTDPSGQQWPVIQGRRIAAVTIPSSPYLSP